MNCATHQQTPAVAYCRTCGKPLCENCKREVHGLIYCEDCIASRVHGVPAGAAVLNPQAPRPGVALVLGMIPGVGAMYCGEFMRAFIHIVIFAALITAADHSDFFGLMAAFWWFYMLFDSYQIAKAKQEGRPVQDVFGFMTSSGLGRSSAASATAPTEPATATPPLLDVNRSQNIPLGPIVLIGLGILFLWHTMGGPDFFPMGKLWPLILVGIGGWLIWQRTQKAACHCVACTAICLMGPAILVTIGVIGMLHEFTPIRWWRSWPLILIVVGVLKFLQITGSREGHIGPSGVPPAGTPPDASSSSPQQNEVSHG